MSHFKIHEVAMRPLARAFVDGFNCCVLVMGETSTGKTHLLGGGGGMGLAPQLFHEIFELVGQLRDHPCVGATHNEVQSTLYSSDNSLFVP